MSEQVLLLNATYEPLKVVPWQKAVQLFFQGKVEVVETYDRKICSVHLSMKVPAVIRLYRLVTFRHVRQMVKFSRETLFARDCYSCQYCGKRFERHELTFDHVVPAARGGPKTWENIVTACRRCNHKKSGKTPEEAGMRLLRKAHRPFWSPAILVMMNLNSRAPKIWADYLFDPSRAVLVSGGMPGGAFNTLPT